MSKIQMIRRNRVMNVDSRLAPLLERHGGYLRRDMQAQLPAQPDSHEIEAQRGSAQAERDAAAAKKVPKVAKKSAKKAVAKAPATPPAPEKGASE
ncbi:hypothetical protein MUG10_00940 [Xanthomonas prunicola]|uniref:hypothetical protein n=1 Tax=Xanthomonas prunicola TaxID=2053930 RepID=UPI002078A7AC|nr:hypothetical protein [Xanthomonas prunicola]USJ00862.1 hypothetical protein MUG10_00940 [Xanthomonas prunicola]